MSHTSNRVKYQNLLQSNEELKTFFQIKVSSKVEKLMNLNTSNFLNEYSNCFKKEGLDLGFASKPFETSRPAFQDPKSLNYGHLSMFNIPMLIEFDRHKSIKNRTSYSFDIQKLTRQFLRDLSKPRDLGAFAPVDKRTLSRLQSKNISKEEERRLYEGMFKGKMDDREAVKRIAQCVKRSKEEHAFLQKRYVNFLGRFEDSYKECLRNCKFEIVNSFPKCCAKCQDYLYKVVDDMHDSRR